ITVTVIGPGNSDGVDSMATDNVRVVAKVIVPPTATTQAATAITKTGATLNASVNPHGSHTAVSFVYSTDPTLTTGTTTTPAQDIGGGPSPVLVTAPVTGLVPGLT